MCSVADQTPVFALVEVEAGFLACDRVDSVHEPVFAEQHLGRKCAGGDADARRQPLQDPDFRVGAFDHTCHAVEIHQCFDDRRSPVLGPGRKQLHHDHIAIAIDDEPGQTVGLTVYQSCTRVRIVQKRRAGTGGVCDPMLEKGTVNRFRRSCGPDAGANLRHRGVRGMREPRATCIRDGDRCAGLRVADNLRDRSRKYPRMTMQHRSLTTLPQDHGRYSGLQHRRVEPRGRWSRVAAAIATLRQWVRPGS